MDLLLIPGGGGNISQMEALARRLPARVTVPVAAGFDAGRPARTVEAAGRRCAHLLERQPGPRVVVGYSFGALVAHHLAGFVPNVALLVLIDPPPIENIRWSYLSRRREAREKHRSRRESEPTVRERYWLGRLAGSVVMEFKVTARYVHALRRARTATESPGAYAPRDSPLWHACLLATAHYRPSEYRGETLVIHRSGWEPSVWMPPVLAGRTSHVEIATDHLGLMREPVVVDVAHAIAAALNALRHSMARGGHAAS